MKHGTILLVKPNLINSMKKKEANQILAKLWMYFRMNLPKSSHYDIDETFQQLADSLEKIKEEG